MLVAQTISAPIAIYKIRMYIVIFHQVQGGGLIRDSRPDCSIRGTDDEVADDLSGSYLPEELVTKAKREELAEMQRRSVWTKVPIEDCWKATGRNPIPG